jgi:hypothetical protein
MRRVVSDLAAVDLEQEADLFPVVFIDKASYKAVLWTFLTFLFFESAYVYTGLHTPSLVNVTTIDYPLVQEYNNRMADVKLRIAPLSTLQRFLRLDAALARHSAFRAYSDGIVVNSSISYSAKGQRLDSHVSPRQNHKYHFSQGADVSNYINIFFTKVTNFDAIELSITFEADLFFCKGFKLTYSFADPSLARFKNAIRVVLAGSAAYTFVGFLICLKSGSSNFQRTTIVLGVAAVCATNPLGMLLPRGVDDVVAPLTVAVFMAVFRWFVFHLVDSLVREDDAIFKGRAFIYIPALIAYAVIESAAGVLGSGGVNTDGTRSVSIFDGLLFYCHVGYCAVGLVGLAHAYVATVDAAHFKVVSFGAFILVTVVMTLVSEVFWRRVDVTKGSSLPLLLYQSTHILAAIVFIFFQHSSKGFEDFDFADKPGDRASKIAMDE